MKMESLDRIANELADIIYGETKGRVTHAVYFEVLFKALAPWERRLKAMLARIWDEERRIIIANLKKLKGYRGKAPQGLIDSILYPKKRFVDVLTAEAKVLFKALILEEGKRYLDMLDLDVRFDVTNPSVTRWLNSYTPEFSESLEKVNVEKLRATLIEGMEAGETIPELMARVNETYETFDRYRAEIIARSETSRASNQAALEGYAQSGVVERKVWMTAPDCCDVCAELDGMVVALEDSFFQSDYDVAGEGQAPPRHPNCVLPGTRCVTPGNWIAGIRAWYDGQAIQLTLSNGGQVSVTPNHLFLTPHGFASSELLCEGDEIFYCPSFQGMLGSDPYNNGQPSIVEEIIGSLAESADMTTRSMPVTPKDLHGDGRFCDGDIDIIGPHGSLEDTSQALPHESLAEATLDSINANAADLSRFRSLALFFQRAALAADGIVGGLRQASPFFLARLRHAQHHGCVSISGDNVIINQAAANYRSCNSEALGDGQLRDPRPIPTADEGIIGDPTAFNTWGPGRPHLYSDFSQAHSNGISAKTNNLGDICKGFSGLIETTRITQIERFLYHGHVYDLQTSTSLYIANGIVSSNCRCSIAADID